MNLMTQQFDKETQKLKASYDTINPAFFGLLASFFADSS